MWPRPRPLVTRGVSPQHGDMKMKTRLTCLIAALASGLVLGPQSNAAVGPSPRLLRSPSYDAAAAGIVLGSSLQEVHTVFGTPSKESDGSFFRVRADGKEVKGDSKQLVYSGFTVELVRTAESSDFRAALIKVRSDALWLTPGIRVGMPRAKLQALLGEPSFAGVDGGT